MLSIASKSNNIPRNATLPYSSGSVGWLVMLSLRLINCQGHLKLSASKIILPDEKKKSWTFEFSSDVKDNPQTLLSLYIWLCHQEGSVTDNTHDENTTSHKTTASPIKESVTFYNKTHLITLTTHTIQTAQLQSVHINTMTQHTTISFKNTEKKSSVHEVRSALPRSKQNPKRGAGYVSFIERLQERKAWFQIV